MSSRSDFELPSSQGKKDHPVSYIKVGVRKEEAHQLLRDSPALWGWGAQCCMACVLGILPTGALKEFPRQLLTLLVGKSQERDVGKQLGDDAFAESLGWARLGWRTGWQDVLTCTCRRCLALSPGGPCCYPARDPVPRLALGKA